jgi:hypothetical protein
MNDDRCITERTGVVLAVRVASGATALEFVNGIDGGTF